MKQVMLDIETLGCEPDAVILSIAAVAFDAFADYQAQGLTLSDVPQLHVLVDLECQSQRSISEDTLTWWGQQPAEIQQRVFADTARVSLESALDQLHSFVWNSSRVWSQGVAFDFSILEHAYRSVGRAYPWNYWQVRDSRTLLDLVSVPRLPVNHDALEDCWGQVLAVQQALHALQVQQLVR